MSDHPVHVVHALLLPGFCTQLLLQSLWLSVVTWPAGSKAGWEIYSGEQRHGNGGSGTEVLGTIVAPTELHVMWQSRDVPRW